MESNRDDAHRCLQLAASALEVGNVDKATRLLEKSRRMYPLPTQQDQLFNAIQNHVRNGQSTPLRRPQAPQAPQSPDSAVKSTASSSSQRKPSKQMIAAVADIEKLHSKSHYDVLRLSRDCNQDEIKKSYRKLALRLHPDRNFAPGADEAFKRVGQAFVTLSDPKRRDYYDRTGADEPGQPPRSNLRSRRTATHRHFAANSTQGDFFDMNELTPEQLFEFVFARAAGNERAFRRAPRHFEESPLSLWQRFKLFILIALVIVLTIVVSESRSYPLFSLNRTSYHSVRQETKSRIPYYIAQGAKISSRNVRDLQRQVDLKALDQYRLRCAEEKDHASYLWRQSRRWFISDTVRARYKEKYENFEQPWCRKTQALKNELMRYW